jgi:hypothetical protein
MFNTILYHTIPTDHDINRGVLNQTGTGQFSPLGGYDAKQDMVLIMDVARFKYPPHWVPLPLLHQALQAVDPDSGKPRGILEVSAVKESGLQTRMLSCCCSESANDDDDDDDTACMLRIIAMDKPPPLSASSACTGSTSASSSASVSVSHDSNRNSNSNSTTSNDDRGETESLLKKPKLSA